MPAVYAGTSGWAYTSWKPDFYPQKLSAAKFLGYYSSKLNSVELNFTFRRLPTEKQLAGWIAATPADFKFAVKAHQVITHIKRLHDAAEFTVNFISTLQPLAEAGKLGPVLFQLPPFLKCDLPRLTEFLAVLPRNLRAAFEFRHESWFTDDVFAALKTANVALCRAESENLQTPDVQTADFVYLRLRKPDYSAEVREQLAQGIRGLGAHADVFAYFKHEETAEGALYAQALLAATQN